MVRFLTRRGCLLCEEALPLVRREAERAGLSLEIVDVEADDTLHAEFGFRIPVVLGPDGRVVAEGVIDQARPLRRAFRRMAGGGWLRRPRRR